MRLASTVALALCVALAAPISANASDAATTGVYGSFNPAATALAPDATAPVAPTMNSDDNYDGLSRHRDQCNMGCIDNGTD